LIPGYTYFGGIRAENAAGASDWGLHDADNPPWPTASTIPDAVKPPEIINVTQTSFSILLFEPYDNGAPITHYRVFWHRVRGPLDDHQDRIAKLRLQQEGKQVDDSPPRIPGVDEIPWIPLELDRDIVNAVAGHLVDGLEPGTTYRVKYEAHNEHGPGEPSIVVQVVTLPGHPDAPIQLRNAMGSPIPPPDAEE